MYTEVVEYACGIAPDLMGEYVENVSSGMDTYSIKQPLGVSTDYGNHVHTFTSLPTHWGVH